MRTAIDSSLNNHRLGKYHLMSMRVNLTKEEVSQLSSEMVQQMFQELHLEELRGQSRFSNNHKDTLMYLEMGREVKAAFSFIDTVSSAWLLRSDSARKIDTIPAILYKTKYRIGRVQTKQLYNYLIARLQTDTVVLIKQ